MLSTLFTLHLYSGLELFFVVQENASRLHLILAPNAKVILSCQSLLGSVIIGTLKQIAQREGFRGMYRGLSPTILALLPNWAVSIYLYTG